VSSRVASAPELLAVTVMPGPQMVAAIPLCRAFKAKYPSVPVVWGGYFPSLYPDASLNANYVDFVVRGQGEHTFTELLAATRAGGGYEKVRGISFKDRFGLHVHNPERPMQSPGDFPWFHLSPARSGAVHPAHIPRFAHYGAPVQHRMSVPVQLLWSGPGVRS